ncbi:MAG: hypothetical protein KDA96_11940 [Planctomycetaceae bacterium]|nr:hypothetical protein [Planctomycetaceae bacterium]
MKLIKLLPGSVAILLAGSVAAGSVYVVKTVSTVDEPAQEQPEAAAVVEAPPAAIHGDQDKEWILHDRSHDIVMDAQGGFRGRIGVFRKSDGELVPIGRLEIKLLEDGHVAASTSTAADGTFRFSDQTEGVKGLVAITETGMLIYGIRLVASNPPADYTNEFAVNTAVVAASDMARARSLVISHLPDSDHRFQQEVTNIENAYPYGTNNLSTSIQSHTVALQSDGTLNGEVNLMDERTGRFREVEDLTVFLLRDGQQVGQARVNEDGSFQILALSPGVHSLVVGGSDGIVAMGVNLVSQQVAMNPEAHGYLLTSIAAELDLVVAPVNAGNLNQNNFGANTGEQTPSPTPQSPAGASTGPGGSTGGGSGSAGGGDGLGALLGLGAGAAIGAAIADDNSPASPGN